MVLNSATDISSILWYIWHTFDFNDISPDLDYPSSNQDSVSIVLRDGSTESPIPVESYQYRDEFLGTLGDTNNLTPVLEFFHSLTHLNWGIINGRLISRISYNQQKGVVTIYMNVDSEVVSKYVITLGTEHNKRLNQEIKKKNND